ncbi:MAG: amino acid ABC transporter substrate-binding protein [Cyanobacteria bacterium P01_H01_bin.15]
MQRGSGSSFGVSSLLVAMSVLAGCGGEIEPSGNLNKSNRLNVVQNRGTLICGINGQLPGFSFVTESGDYAGMDVDLCRAIAAALFDDPEQVEYVSLSSQERFTAVQTGEVDVLNRNTTWTLSRETAVGMGFGPTIFYDGQGMMVPQDSPISSLADLEGKTICVKAGTTTELNLEDQLSRRDIDYQPVIIEDDDALFAAYAEQRCDAVTADRSQLVVQRERFEVPSSHRFLETLLSKEPLGAVVAAGDASWLSAVRWITNVLIQAEEFGITSENLDSFLETDNPEIRRILGLEGTLGDDMGLPPDFAVRVIRAVGNYDEIYERNIGQPYQLDRGLNQLWSEGGLLYSPPFR